MNVRNTLINTLVGAGTLTAVLVVLGLIGRAAHVVDPVSPGDYTPIATEIITGAVVFFICVVIVVIFVFIHEIGHSVIRELNR